MYKLKKYLIIIFLISLNNCATPGVALLSPAVTGVTTKSTQQASLSLASSLSSSQILKKHHKKIIHNVKEKKRDVLNYFNNLHFHPIN